MEEIKLYMYSDDELFMHSKEAHFGVYHLSCEAMKTISTKRTLLSVHKEFWMGHSVYIKPQYMESQEYLSII